MLQKDANPDQLLVHIVFLASRRTVLHEEKLTVPFAFSFEDLQNIIEVVQRRSLTNVVLGDDLFFFVRRGSMVPIHHDNFKILIRERVNALRRNHLLNKKALLFEMPCFPVARNVETKRESELVALGGPRDGGQSGQPLEELIKEASDDLQKEYEKLRVLEFLSIQEENGVVRMRLRVNSSVYQELAGLQHQPSAPRPVFTMRTRRRLSLEDFKKGLSQ